MPFLKVHSTLLKMITLSITGPPTNVEAMSASDFRSISLCNFRIQNCCNGSDKHVENLVTENDHLYQSGFVLGRQIQNNILIVHEMFHHLKINGKRGETTRNPDSTLKIDMQKVYDNV